MTTEIELRLIDASAPSGEVAAKDLAALAAALQELMTRITSDVVTAADPGRARQFIEELSQLRLNAVEAGSTVLRFSKGPTGKLDADSAEQTVADDRFWEVVHAIAEGHRPDWVSDWVAASVGRLINAIRAAAPTVMVSGISRGEVRISAAATHRETWTTKRVTSGAAMSAAGWLEKVDLRAHEFRLRDDVDNTVILKHVENDTAAAHLVGRWVEAQGIGILHASGRLIALEHACVIQVDDPAADYVGRKVVSTGELLASAPGPDPDGGLDLTEEEAIAFLEALRS